MEQINKVELRGVVGNVRTSNVSGKTVYDFSLATNRAFKDRGGTAVIETQWHQVTTWDASDGTNEGLEHLDKGSKVFLTGRIQYERYLASDGIERNRTKIISTRVVVLDGPDQLDYEM